MGQEIENLILKGIYSSSEFTTRTLNYIKPEYFEDNKNQLIFKVMHNYISENNNLPKLEFIKIELNDKFTDQKIPDNLIRESIDFTDEIFKNKLDFKDNINYAIKIVEKWVRDRAYNLALQKAIETMQSNPTLGPELLSDALSITFDNKYGHDYIEDASERLRLLNCEEEKIPFHLKKLNEVTGGGIEKKTINIILAGTNVGKTLFKCAWAAKLISLGYNCLYITLEMAEEKIAARIDANLLDMDMIRAKSLKEDVFINSLKKKVKGRLIVKEYPSANINEMHIRNFLNELKLRKQFTPDVIFIDYMNLMLSKRIKDAGNSYGYVKAIAEELRGLAKIYEVPIITSTQATRSGQSNTDLELEHVGESKGTSDTADFLFALMSSEELEAQDRILIKQLKSRYGNKSRDTKFLVGINRDKMQLYDIDNSVNGVINNLEDSVNKFNNRENKNFNGIKI